MRVAALVTAVFTAVFVGQSAFAQDRFVEVGLDSVELPVLLDLTTVKGEQFDLLSQYANLRVQTSMTARCQQKRLFIKQITLFYQKGEVVTQDKKPKELFSLKPDGASYRAMQLVCRQR